MSEVDSATLLARWQAGDPRAGAAFFDRYYDSVLRFFRNKVNPSVGDDLAQNTFIAASKAAFGGRSKVRTWLLSIAWRKLSDHCRAEARRLDIPTDETLSVADLGQSPESKLVQRAELRLLLEGLRRLPLIYQTVLELHYWEKLSGSQISAVLDLPLGTVKGRIRDGRQRLGHVLESIADSAEVLRTTIDDLDQWAERAQPT